MMGEGKREAEQVKERYREKEIEKGEKRERESRTPN